MKRLLIAVFALLVTTNILRAQTPHYQGKTMTIVVGTVAGDLYDLSARAIALFMGKYLPGNPNIIVQNLPGAGHMIAANYVYSVAKPDGLTIAGTLPSLYFEQLIGRAEVKFNWAKFSWIGNATKSPQVLSMRADDWLEFVFYDIAIKIEVDTALGKYTFRVVQRIGGCGIDGGNGTGIGIGHVTGCGAGLFHHRHFVVQLDRRAGGK